MLSHSKKKKIKGGRQKLKLFRASEPLKSVLMWGINHSMATMLHVKPRAMLLKDDFKAYFKIKVKSYLFNKESMPSRFNFKEYCPLVFQNLRIRFNVDPYDFWESFTRYQPLWDILCSKSSSRILISPNRHYVIKIISSEEIEEMHNIIEKYHEYVVNRYGKTLLPQYLGMYRITVNDQETYLLAMRNFFSPRITVHKKYYLKGNHLERESGDKEKSTLKDKEFIEDNCKIAIGVDACIGLLDTLDSDILFLQENNLMNYSFLVGIHDTELANHQCGWNEEEAPDLAVDYKVSADDGLGVLFEKRAELEIQTDSLAHPTSPICTPSTNAPPTFNQFRSLYMYDDADADESNIVEPFSGLSDSPEDFIAPNAFFGHIAGSSIPPDCSDDLVFNSRPFNGDLNPITEFYAFRGSENLCRPVIYFLALTDALKKFGMRNRTAITYRTVKQATASEHSSVRPDVYGRRLVKFISQFLE